MAGRISDDEAHPGLLLRPDQVGEGAEGAADRGVWLEVGGGRCWGWAALRPGPVLRPEA